MSTIKFIRFDLILVRFEMIWVDLCDLIRFDMIWYWFWLDLRWFMIWFDSIRHDLILILAWSEMTYDLIWFDSTWFDIDFGLIWDDLWFDLIRFDMIWYWFWLDMSWFDSIQFNLVVFHWILFTYGLMLSHRPQRWPNIKPTLGQCVLVKLRTFLLVSFCTSYHTMLYIMPILSFLHLLKIKI